MADSGKVRQDSVQPRLAGMTMININFTRVLLPEVE
jgi:hypothetical protein